jgi:predicted GNAT family acetyltransferase
MIKKNSVLSFDEVEFFIQKNVKKSQFTCSSIVNNLDNAYYYEVDNQIQALYYITSLNFMTLIFDDEISREVKTFIFEDLYRNTTAMIKVVEEDVSLSKVFYAKEPVNNATFTAILQNSELNTFKPSKYVIELNESHIQEYLNSIEGVFGPIDEDTIRKLFELDKIYGFVSDGKVLCAASVAAITPNYCMIASVFTHPRLLNKGLATVVLNHVLNIYATNSRVIAIQYSTEIAKHLYLKLGFVEYHNLNILHRKHTHLCNEDNLELVQDFLINQQNSAPFIDSNLLGAGMEVYFLKHEEKIVGLYSIINNHYISFLVCDSISKSDFEFLLIDSLNKSYVEGSIVGGNHNLIKKYYKINSGSTIGRLVPKENNKFNKSKYVRQLTLDDFEVYKEYYKLLGSELNYDNFKLNLNKVNTYGYFKFNKLVSVASTKFSTAYFGVVGSFTTLDNQQNTDYTTAILNQMFHDLNEHTRSLYVFYNKSINDTLYKKLNFQEYDNLITIKPY